MVYKFFALKIIQPIMSRYLQIIGNYNCFLFLQHSEAVNYIALFIFHFCISQNLLKPQVSSKSMKYLRVVKQIQQIQIQISV